MWGTAPHGNCEKAQIMEWLTTFLLNPINSYGFRCFDRYNFDYGSSSDDFPLAINRRILLCSAMQHRFASSEKGLAPGSTIFCS